jgi:hypothetical protein
MPPILILAFVFAVGLIGLSVTILRRLRRGEAFHWVQGGPLNYLLVFLIVILGAIMAGEVTGIQHILVGLSVPPRVADILALLPIVAAGIVFAFNWRRASAARVRQ